MFLDIKQYKNRQLKILKDVFRYFECLIVYLEEYLSSAPDSDRITQIITYFLTTYYMQNFEDYKRGKIFKTPQDFVETDTIYELIKTPYDDERFKTLRKNMKAICLSIFEFETRGTQSLDIQSLDISSVNGITDGRRLNQLFSQLPPPFQFRIPNLSTNPNLGPINHMCTQVIERILGNYPTICRIKNDDEKIQSKLLAIISKSSSSPNVEVLTEQIKIVDESQMITAADINIDVEKILGQIFKKLLEQIYEPFLNLVPQNLNSKFKTTETQIIESIRESLLISKKFKRNIAHIVSEEDDLIEGGSNFQKITFIKTKTKKNKKRVKKFIKTKKNKKNVRQNTKKNRKNRKNIRKSRK